jgi:hypothetical protein
MVTFSAKRRRFFGDAWRGAGEEAAILARFRPHPIKTLLEPLRLTNPAAAAVPGTYLACRQSPGAARRAAQQRARPGWGYREIDAPHLAPFTHPNEVATLLLEVAWRPASVLMR